MWLSVTDENGVVLAKWYLPQEEILPREVGFYVGENFSALRTLSECRGDVPTASLSLCGDNGIVLARWFFTPEELDCREVEKYIADNLPVYSSRPHYERVVSDFACWQEQRNSVDGIPF